jgi:rhodanese-related sulfurtransferase
MRFSTDIGFVALFWGVLGAGAFGLSKQMPAMPQPAKASVKTALREMDFSQVQRAIEGGATIFDARKQDEFVVGHIPTARNLPRNDFDPYSGPLVAKLTKHAFIVVYCSGLECTDAEIVARKLQRLGFDQVGIYRGGWEEWRENGPIAR